MPFALQIISFITDTLFNFLPLGLWMTPSGSIDSALSTAQTNIKKLLFGREDRLTPAQKLLRISESQKQKNNVMINVQRYLMFSDIII